MPAIGPMTGGWPTRPLLVLLIALSVAVFCMSAANVSKYYVTYQLVYDPLTLNSAVIAVAIFAPVFLLFAIARFSFGYFAGFYLCSMVLSYLWLSFFSLRIYDHDAARLSAAVSAILFLLPALFVSSPLPQIPKLSVRSFDRLLIAIFLVCVATVAMAASYNFTLVSPDRASSLRTDALPRMVNYLIGMETGALLPFLFAYCVARRAIWQAGAIAVLMLLYYPIAVSKMTFFAPVWLVGLAVLAKIFEARVAVVLSLMLPIAAGVLLFTFMGSAGPVGLVAGEYDFIVNFRMLAVPALALDLYNEFFSRHELTRFCQIGILKRFVDCPYQEQLAVVMLHYFPAGGTYNSSLFATEGIASAGWLYAPITVFICGVVIALGNRACAGLSPSFVLVSSGMLVQNLLNTPLSTVLLTHGGVLLFLLWYLMPRQAGPAQATGDPA
ncbi:hypothetical protein IVB38_34925 [Bradyrhizobium sp. 38]|uniref:hypothetical protein n=1 Tax=unclassified Bradyrhizobium TaxID=2631580 RepID=UPI001FFAE96F|nr:MULTISPECIES: hypothetical protein [unclassified Bradyrhizobium]MCK1341073.1 hypothetical protein [Bradyrhizobium sp. 38]MCK1780919.1 hypothetical protein [Bradyrhizobium sp. 132]